MKSGTGGTYEVEIRTLDGFANSCGCIDHRVNGLGACKHIEGVLAAVGLNLQAATAVVNVDLPWNPAKLEQRIARAWRKNQLRSVKVANLVCEDSIEHNILHLLASKQALSDGRARWRRRSREAEDALRPRRFPRAHESDDGAAPPIRSAEERIVEDLRERYGAGVVHCEARSHEGSLHLLAVLDVDAAEIATENARLASQRNGATPPVEAITRDTWEVLNRLARNGLMQFSCTSPKILFSVEGGSARL
ncbi:MAG TPA: C-terminal helicase domain-containing protein [Rhizomicrobium sp.]